MSPCSRVRVPRNRSSAQPAATHQGAAIPAKWYATSLGVQQDDHLAPRASISAGDSSTPPSGSCSLTRRSYQRARRHGPDPSVAEIHATHPQGSRRTSVRHADQVISESAPPAPESARDAAPQYVLPLVLRLESEAPPERTDALETAARAVLTLLSDPRVTTPDGEWAPLVDAWQDGRIRKVVRRARGAEWWRAGELPGITVAGATAEYGLPTGPAGRLAQGSGATPGLRHRPG